MARFSQLTGGGGLVELRNDAKPSLYAGRIEISCQAREADVGEFRRELQNGCVVKSLNDTYHDTQDYIRGFSDRLAPTCFAVNDLRRDTAALWFKVIIKTYGMS
jgi:hypothetical protein